MDTESNSLPDAKTLFERMCIDGTRFQAQKFMSAVESYEGLSEALNQGEEITPNYLPLLSDVFSSFFQNKARLKQNPPRETEENREIMETALGLKEYEELHTVSRLDFFASAAATRAFSDQILKLIKEKKEEDQKDPRERQNETMALWESIPTPSAGRSGDHSRRDWKRPKKQNRRSRPSEETKEGYNGSR